MNHLILYFIGFMAVFLGSIFWSRHFLFAPKPKTKKALIVFSTGLVILVILLIKLVEEQRIETEIEAYKKISCDKVLANMNNYYQGKIQLYDEVKEYVELKLQKECMIK